MNVRRSHSQACGQALLLAVSLTACGDEPDARAKGCTRCHQLDAGYADGPDLRGVTQRRNCEWVVALLTDTENMIQTDPDLQQLRVEHFLDMPDHHLSVVEARALFAYLRVAAGR